MQRFKTVGVVRNQPEFDRVKLDEFSDGIDTLIREGVWDKDAIVKLFLGILPEFEHKETGRYLDQRM